jgi:hypothetical protein
MSSAYEPHTSEPQPPKPRLRTADIYIQRARELIQQDSDIERPQWLAAAIARLVKYEQKAGREDNLQTAIKALETQAKLLRFDL